MVQLIAEGAEPRQRWRMELLPGNVYVLGRDPSCDLPVPWDPQISRKHAELAVADGRLIVRRLSATNALYHAGQAVESCTLRSDEHFVLGGTTFLVQAHSSGSGSGASSALSARPVEEMTFSREVLEHVRFRDPDRRIEVLSHLPQVIWGTRSDTELYVRLVNLLLAGISAADAAAIVSLEGDALRVHQWDRRRETAGAFRPSRRLAQEAIQERRQSVLHVWTSAPQRLDITASQEFDWAFCTPIAGPAQERLGLYLAGRFAGGSEVSASLSLPKNGSHLQADVKFAELVAEIVGSVRKLNVMERQQAGLRQFFPPVILGALSDDPDTALLAPREAEVTVMFCDLRGFSKQAEVSRHDLIGLLDRVSQALGVMTHHILHHGGVIGDFQGDAAMGFWGWPVPTSDAPLHACRAALDIRAAFAAAAGQAGHALSNFEMGIGMARGRAVAGKIGTNDHVKVTVFGPVVNLASRLEGMTKQLRVPIIIDESLADLVRTALPPEVGRTRRLAKVLPYGMDTPVLVSELLPPEQDAPELSDTHLRAYDEAVDCFIAGKWERAYRLLRDLPSGDRAQDFLAVLIAQHNRVAPGDWNGIVRLPSK